MTDDMRAALLTDEPQSQSVNAGVTHSEDVSEAGEDAGEDQAAETPETAVEASETAVDDSEAEDSTETPMQAAPLTGEDESAAEDSTEADSGVATFRAATDSPPDSAGGGSDAPTSSLVGVPRPNARPDKSTNDERIEYIYNVVREIEPLIATVRAELEENGVSGLVNAIFGKMFQR